MKWQTALALGVCLTTLSIAILKINDNCERRIKELTEEVNVLKVQNEEMIKAAQIYEEINKHIMNGDW